MGMHRAAMWKACGVILVSLSLVTITSFDIFAASRHYRGQFASSVVVDGCTSAVTICTHGTLTGGLNGEFDFTATSLSPTIDSATTSVLTYTGDIEITSRDGTLFCKDAGAFQSVDPGAVSSVCTIVGGTGDYTGATGYIQFVGTFTFADGGDGEYRAVINVP